MIKVKEFTCYYERVFDNENKRSKLIYHSVSEYINNFLDNNKNITIIDIKYSSGLDTDNDLWSTALLIYKENVTKPQEDIDD